MIVWSDFIEDGFLALDASVFYHISLIFSMVYTYRGHLSMALGCPITGTRIVHMLGAEAEGAVVSGRAFRVGGYGFVAPFTLERFIVHHKGHILQMGITIKMSGKFPEKMYELRFIERVFFHETSERFRRIIERYVVISFPYHHIEESPVLIPSEYSFTVCERIFLHDAVEEKIDISNDAILPVFIGKRILSVLLVMNQLVSRAQFPKDQYLIEEKKRELFCKLLKKHICFPRKIQKRR